MKRKFTIEDLIFEKLKSGKTYREISIELHVSYSRISRVSNEIKKTNNSPAPLKMGRPIKISNTDIQQLVYENTIKNPTESSICISQNIMPTYNINVSRRFVDQIRHKLGFNFTKPRKKPVLTEMHIKKKIEFCRKQLENSIDWSCEVIITDESKFSSSPDHSGRWIKRGVYNKGSYVEEAKFNKSIMVWA